MSPLFYQRPSKWVAINFVKLSIEKKADTADQNRKQSKGGTMHLLAMNMSQTSTSITTAATTLSFLPRLQQHQPSSECPTLFRRIFWNRRRNPNNLKLRACAASVPSNSYSNSSSFPLASKIIVKNLAYSTSETCLQREFSSFGEIAEVKLVKEESTKRSKGYAFIQYTCQDDAMLALENMDGKIFDGRLIFVELAKPGKDRFAGYPKTSGPPKKLHFQEQDEIADCWSFPF